MSSNKVQPFLPFLEECHNKGETAIVLHVFLSGREIGKLAIAGDQASQSGGLPSDLCERLKQLVSSKAAEFATQRLFEFQFNCGEAAFSVIGEFLEAPAHLYIFGAGHVGQAVAIIGAIVGYDVVVMDDRAEFLTRERFPDEGIRLLNGCYTQIRARINMPNNSAAVIVTRGHQYDEVCLEQVLMTNARYIGMIGSRRRVLSIFARLAAAGVDRIALDRVHAPIGLKIGAVSPQEIAVAIIAQIISVMNNRRVNQLTERREQS